MGRSSKEGKKTTKKMSVTSALQELSNLKKVDSEHYDSADITETYTKKSTDNSILEKEPTSDVLNEDTETGFGFNPSPKSSDEIESRIENANLKVESKIKTDLHAVKDKCLSISLTVSLSVCALVSAILISVMIYMNNDIKSEIVSLKEEVMSNITILRDNIKNVNYKLITFEKSKKPNSATDMNKKTEKN